MEAKDHGAKWQDLKCDMHTPNKASTRQQNVPKHDCMATYDCLRFKKYIWQISSMYI